MEHEVRDKLLCEFAPLAFILNMAHPPRRMAETIAFFNNENRRGKLQKDKDLEKYVWCNHDETKKTCSKMYSNMYCDTIYIIK